MQKIKKPISILLSVLMVLSVFAVVPFTASAASNYEVVDVTDIVKNASSVSELQAALDDMVSVSIDEGNAWEPPLKSGYERLILYFDDDSVRFTIFNNGSYVNNAGTSDYDFFKGASAKFYYLKQVAPTTYTITWNNEDGSLIDTTVVEEGVVPTHDDATKEADDTYTYTFSGWDPTPVAAAGDTTYTAKFDATPKPHEHDGVTFEKWTSDNSLPTEAGNYVLTSDVTLSGTWTVPAGETNLCLAGFTIRQSGSGSVILLNNVNDKLTVYDDGTTGTITGGNTNSIGGGVNIAAGTFTLKGGNIEGNVADNGGGVSVVGPTSYFTMTGGTIRYNAGYGNTGGVLQVSNDNFTMTGGEICYNVGKNFGGIGIADAHPNMSGNAVVKNNVIFNDVSATNTKITKTDSGYTIDSGGTPCDVKHASSNGLKINVIGAFETGAQIGIFNNNQTAAFTSGFGTYNPDGSPVHYFFSNDSERFLMVSEDKEALLGGYYTVIWRDEDGAVLEIDENVASGTTPEFNGTEPTKASDGVATAFEFAGWTPAVSPVTGDVTYTATYHAIMPDHEHDGIVYQGWASKDSLPTEAGNYYLGYDVTLPSTWTVSKDIRLCLNGNGITRNGGNVITIEGGTLTIDDCGTKTHYFDVNNGKAVNVNTTPGENRNSFTGGYITGGTGQGYDGYFWGEGGGIYLDGGNLILNGGTILGNSAVFGGGVGIFSGTMTMNGGTVCYNTGNAGISFRTGSNEYNRGRGASTGYFVMNGGLVAHNSSGVTTAGYSYNNDFATFNGGKIADNANTGIYSLNITIDGDIEITGNKYGAAFRDTCSISGNPVITGNTNANLSINIGKTINTGAFGENAKIGITRNAPGVFTTGFKDNNTLVPTDVFTEDDPLGTKVINSAEGEGELKFIMATASFNAGDGSGTIDPIEVQKGNSFDLPLCTFTAPEGKLFLNWSDGTNTYKPGDSYTMTADTEFTAQWIDGIKVSFEANGGSGVMEDVLSYAEYALPACGFTAPEGKFFGGWLSSADNQVYQTGDPVTLTAETQFTAQWLAGAKYLFDFAEGVPTGWQTSNSNWFLNTYGGDYEVFDAHSFPNNMTYYHGGYNTYGELLTSSFDLTNAERATLGFWYTNRDWYGDTDQLSVSYQVGDDDWVQLFATDGNHEGWTKEEITLPSEAFAENVRFRFSVNGNYGYGVALDDVELKLNCFTVTWNNWDGTELEKDEDVIKGTTPTFDGATPTKPADDTNTYTFSGWYDDTTTYAPADLPEVTGDVTYTAQFTSKPKTLISGHSLSLGGDIGINFYIDPSVAGMTAGEAVDKLTYTLEWENEDEAKKALTDLGASISDDGKSVIVTCEVCAAEMTCGIKASFNLGNKSENEVYSVRKYCDEGILADGAPYRDDQKLYNLANAMLDYGAKAQTVFGIKTDVLANEGLKYTMPEEMPDFDAAVYAANGRNADNIAEQTPAGGTYGFVSLVFLSESTLRLYFEKNTDEFSTEGMTEWNEYYYAEASNIAAKNLDTLQEFNVSGETLRFSALDYAKKLAEHENTAYNDLGKALYWYNQAANVYYGDQ